MPKQEQEKNYGFPAKWDKKLKASTFKEDANTMSDDELKKVILDCENSIREQEKLKEADFKLKQAQELVKDLNGAYKDSIDFDTAKIKYSLFMLESRGKI
jgi:hypothetical protein